MLAPQRDGGEHGSSDDATVGEIVHGATDEDQRGAAVVRFTIVGVAVVPDNQLLQHKEAEDARQQCTEDESWVEL